MFKSLRPNKFERTRNAWRGCSLGLASAILSLIVAPDICQGAATCVVEKPGVALPEHALEARERFATDTPPAGRGLGSEDGERTPAARGRCRRPYHQAGRRERRRSGGRRHALRSDSHDPVQRFGICAIRLRVASDPDVLLGPQRHDAGLLRGGVLRQLQRRGRRPRVEGPPRQPLLVRGPHERSRRRCLRVRARRAHPARRQRQLRQLRQRRPGRRAELRRRRRFRRCPGRDPPRYRSGVRGQRRLQHVVAPVLHEQVGHRRADQRRRGGRWSDSHRPLHRRTGPFLRRQHDPDRRLLSRARSRSRYSRSLRHRR